MNKHISPSNRKLAYALIAVPGILVLGSVIVLLTVNLIFNPTLWMTPDTAPVTPTPIYITAINGVLILLGGIGLLSVLPGLIAGIYLLVKQKKSIVSSDASK